MILIQNIAKLMYRQTRELTEDKECVSLNETESTCNLILKSKKTEMVTWRGI